MALDVTDGQLHASSSRSLYTDANRSPLDTRHDGLHSGAWVAKVDDDQQWLEVSFKEPMTITGLVTKGRDASPQWVTEYVLLYSLDGFMYHYYQDMPSVPKVRHVPLLLLRQAGLDKVVVVAFFSLGRILGECSTIHSPPALFFPFFFLKWRLARAH